MITRNGLTLTITCPDEDTLRGIEWTLRRLLASETSNPEKQSIPELKENLFHPSRLSDAQLAGLERRTNSLRQSRSEALERVSRNREGLMPFRTEKRRDE